MILLHLTKSDYIDCAFPGYPPPANDQPRGRAPPQRVERLLQLPRRPETLEEQARPALARQQQDLHGRHGDKPESAQTCRGVVRRKYIAKYSNHWKNNWFICIVTYCSAGDPTGGDGGVRRVRAAHDALPRRRRYHDLDYGRQ